MESDLGQYSFGVLSHCFLYCGIDGFISLLGFMSSRGFMTSCRFHVFMSVSCLRVGFMSSCCFMFSSRFDVFASSHVFQGWSDLLVVFTMVLCGTNF